MGSLDIHLPRTGSPGPGPHPAPRVEGDVTFRGEILEVPGDLDDEGRLTSQRGPRGPTRSQGEVRKGANSSLLGDGPCRLCGADIGYARSMLVEGSVSGFLWAGEEACVHLSNGREILNLSGQEGGKILIVTSGWRHCI